MHSRFLIGFVLLFLLSACQEDIPGGLNDTAEDENLIDTFSVKKPKPLTEAEQIELTKNKSAVDSIINDAANIINAGNADTVKKFEPEELIVEHPDVAASFNGGEAAMQKYLSKKLIYPLVAFQNEIKGTVMLKVVIEKDGRVGSIKVLRGIGYGCDESATDCVRAMPNWIPGKKGGVNVRSVVVIPLTFGS